MQKLPPIEIDPDTFLRQHCTLPSLPPLVTHIQQLSRDSNADIQDVVALISSDPALVAQILKVVNSAYYSLPQEITKIQFAIAFLGLSEIYRMVLSLSVIKAMEIGDQRELSCFWYHSYYTSLCTRHLAKKHAPALLSDELWSAAILHDIGKLVFFKFFPEHFAAVNELRTEQGCLFSEAEEQLEVPPSAYMGALLCEQWMLPTQIRLACRHHTLCDLKELSSENSARDFIRMICLGNLTAVLAAEELGDAKKHDIAETVKASLGCGEQDFLDIMAEMYYLRLEVDAFMSRFS